MKSRCVLLGLMFAWILDSTARAYLCSEVTDAVLEQALQCVHKILEPNMTENFEKSKASKDSGMTDLEYVKKEWEKPCTSEDNSIRRLLVPTQDLIEKEKLYLIPKNASSELTPRKNIWKIPKVRTIYGKQQLDYQVFSLLNKTGEKEDMKPKSIYIVDACLNGTIYSFRREGKL